MRVRSGAVAAAVGVIAAVTAPAVAPGVAGAETEETAESPTVLRVAVTQNIDSLNPFIAIFASSTELMRLMYEFVTLPSAEDQSPVGGLAESWETSEDNLTWTFTMRDDVQWSDGEPVTAEDVAFTYNLMLEDEAARTANGNFVSAFESVVAEDETTLVVTTATPQATMLALDIPIVPEHIWSEVDDIASFTNDTMPVVGSGPFILTEYRAEQFIRMEANPDYFRGPAEIDELQFLFYRNADAAVQALRTGEVDLVNRLTPAQVDALRDVEGIAVNEAQGRRFYELATNPGAATRDGTPIGDGHPALEDVRVRQAINQAIDRDVLVDRVLGGYGEPGAGYIPPVFQDYHWTPSEEQRWDFDLDAANELLDEAGYPMGDDGVRVDGDDRPLSFRLYGRSDRAFDTQAGEFVRNWLGEIGIEVDLQIMAGTRLNELTGEGVYDLAFSGWGVNPDPDYVLGIQTCGQRPGEDGTGGTTDAFFCDEEFDDLYAAQLAEFDPEARRALVADMQELFYEQSSSMTLFYENALEAYRSDRFEGFQLQPDPGGVIREQNGYWGYYGAQPADGAAGGGGGVDTGVILAGIAVVVLLGGGAAVLIARRRRATADDRE
ncbi:MULTISPECIES: ABC transporter substrate-binding protein [Actinoalloteichus]|uniref:ABC-type dipeptide transport system, periplasmic component n=1 Tax=Actinoalloteichus fjordicus TaxID=1612552 RepID=A0AAC9LEI1_9PSEU|nr:MULTISPECIES: ABC transporter substrate-binding protein [Actinoalloteichus]APU14845.1 ABC-type dipeptide transport system, periplasmic component [Actinoalloteichus fjordicus]APU20814.1 ABC-type dipeptide transport system, periplasmic component [Actinoalloteichus sp. GBA129-24]